MSRRRNWRNRLHNLQERRDAAKARQDEYDQLTDEQKLKLAKTRPGNSTREINRLTARLKNAK